MTLHISNNDQSNASPAQAQTHVDVLIVGAGVSGIGAAHHLMEQCPDKSFLIFETKEAHGGTWLTHKYPGIRSDSDLYTFGYRFKPWSSAPIAEAGLILDYMGDVIKEDNLERYIRYNHTVTKASWLSDQQVWRVDVTNQATGELLRYTCTFLYMCQGYYDHNNPYTPDWPGLDAYQGEIIHPQLWPEDTNLSGKRVIVIGSGATAATLIPSIADDCGHVTMLQRSPTYFWSGENRNELADQLRDLNVPEEWVHEIVRRSLLKMHEEIQVLSREHPDLVKDELLKGVREKVGNDALVDEHFIPRYRPWQQRLAFVPDGDLFEAVKSGKVDLVTDHIDHFTKTGIMLKSGKHLEADVIITATGFNLLVMGGIPFDIDGEPVDFSQRITYRGLMLTGIPNMVSVFGYLRSSWTLRVDLIGDYVCRLLNHMDAIGAQSVVPELRTQDQGMALRPWISDEDFNSGYLQRGRDKFPKCGPYEPWIYNSDYYTERKAMPEYDLDEDVLHYTYAPQRTAAAASS